MKFIKLLPFAFLICAMLFTSCGGTGKLKFDEDSGLYTDSRTGISYNYAPSCYEAPERGEKYSKWKNSMETVMFYEIVGADPKCWIVEQEGTVFYADSVKLPELGEMHINEVLVCVENEKSIALSSITDAEHIKTLVDTWENGEKTDYPVRTAKRNYRVKFVSPDYHWMYYNLIYVEYTDGESYLFCRDTGRCVRAGDIIKNYLDGIYP